MRILKGTTVVEASQHIIATLSSDSSRKVLDLGAGDGRYVYECARNDPESLYVAIDPDAETLADYAFRASRKPARGGVENALFVVAAVESLPPELHRVADSVRVNFPWGSLMRGLLEPDPSIVQAILGIAKPGAQVEILMSYDPSHDTGAFNGPPLPRLDAAYIESKLLPAYEAAGGWTVTFRRMTQDEALAIPSTWGRRLLHARPRDVFCISLETAGAQ